MAPFARCIVNLRLSDVGEIIFKFPNNIKIIIRQLEKLERKQIKAYMAILFNRTCINENIVPNLLIYIYIYIY